VAWREGAEALIRLGRLNQAYNAVTALARESAVTGAQIASARWLAASTRLDHDDSLWNLEAAGVLVASPGAPEAALALDALIDSGVEVAPLEAAYVRYRTRDNDAATALYETALDSSLGTLGRAVATFYLGALAERVPDGDLAIEYYGETLAVPGTTYLSDDARWWRGLLLEERGDYIAASDAFRTLAAGFPGSPSAARAAIRDPLALLRGGLAVPATVRLRELVRSPSRDTATRAAGWLAIIEGDATTGPQPATFDPTSIATILWLAGEQATAPLPSSALDEWLPSLPDPGGARLWLQSTIGGRPADQRRALDDRRLATTLALLAVGERKVARSMLFDLRWSFSHSPHDLLDIAIEASAIGLDGVALSASTSVLALLTPQQRLGTPIAVEQLAYPLLLGEHFREIAVEAGVPPLLLLALVRQESAFNPDAVSFANAIGLTHVIAPTGEQIANTLGVPWQLADLLIPGRSLRFGAS
jgi:tetratricopeptide (TPR) repeat protein